MTSPLSRILRGALLALALTALGPVAGATAAPGLRAPAAPLLTTAATAVGAAHWGRQACDGQVTVTWEHLGPQANAEARWSAPTGGSPATYLRCTIAYSLDARWDWPKLCTVTEHELGHLNGAGHAEDESDLMSAFYLDATSECRRTPMPGAAPAKAAGRALSARTRKAGARVRSTR